MNTSGQVPQGYKRIGISACIMHPDPSRVVFNGRRLSYIENSMAEWVFRAGAVPVVLPHTAQRDCAARLIESVDGLLLHGGVDLAPESYGETPLRPEWSGDKIRDDFEIALVQHALSTKKPILGICRGHQLLNVALGGTLYQDIQTQVSGALVHRCAERYNTLSHDVDILSNTLLSQLYESLFKKSANKNLLTARINSVHHQAINALAPGFTIEALSTHDKIIEAVRITHGPYKHQFVLGIQWHPEFQLEDECQREDESALLDPMPIMQAFMDAVSQE